MYRKDSIWFYSFGAVLLVATVYVYWSFLQPEWKDYQGEFRDLVLEKFGQERASQVPAGIQQIWVKELGRVDRCVTCHQGMEWKGLDSSPNPFKAHPKEILRSHPLQKYGCTSCHGGQGYATDMDSAHGLVEFWDEPLMGKKLSELYLVRDKSALMQMRCNQCHRYERETKGAGFINQAKALVQAKGCRACHTINGRGGTIGPDLSFVGDKSPEQYDYSRMYGIKSAFAWHVAHLQNPKSLSPESVMPNFSFSTSEAQSLALLVLSWKRTDLPVAYVPGGQPVDRPTPEEAEKERQMLTGEGAFFVKKGCFICHSVTSFGIESATNIGPDLALAAADVQSRFGRVLDDFLASPTGTMAVVLSTQIQLTPAEKKEAVERLKAAYQKKLEQKPVKQ